MADPPLLTLSGIRFHLGDQTILDGVDLSIAPGERLSLVGRNGAGKSTLLRILAGAPIADAGERFAQPGATVAALTQEPDFTGHATVAHYVASALADSQGPTDYRVETLLAEVKLDGGRAPGELSGGEARRAALARVLIAEPDVMLLDEPTNHLDLPTIEWLEEKLGAWRGAYVLVSHDRRFLSTLSRAVLWLDRGIVRRLDRGYDDFEGWSTDILEREATERHKLDRLIELNERGSEWLMALEAREREATGIGSLKVKYNRVFGYFIEITQAHLKSAPGHYQRKQTTVGAERFFTEELKKFEEEAVTAQARQKALEQQLFDELLGSIRELTAPITEAAHRLAELDAFTSLSQLAHRPGWVFPKIGAGLTMDIRAGRHPLVDRGEFVPNDLLLDPDPRLWRECKWAARRRIAPEPPRRSPCGARR